MKKTKILIITIIIFLVLTGGVFAFLYFTTDFLKSNKEMFNKYLAQVDIKNFLNLQEYENYGERILNESHSNEGNISIIAEGNNINEKIEFTTKSNLQSDMASGEIKFIQDDEEKLNMEYLKNEDLYGIKCIYKQYLALVNDNLKEFAQKIGLDENGIPDKIEINMEEIELDETEKELEEIISKYIKLAISKIPDNNYIKLAKQKIEVQGKNIEADGYSVTLNGQEINNILKAIVNNVKDDQQLYNFVNNLMKLNEEDMDFETYQKMIESILSGLDSENVEIPFKLTISVYKQGKDLVKLYVKTEVNEEGNNSYIDFAIENNSTIKVNSVIDMENSENSYIEQEKEEYNFTINKSNDKKQLDITFVKKTEDQEEVNVSFVISIDDLNSENVQTEINLDITSYDESLAIGFTNSTTFDENIEVEEFSNVEYVLLSDYSKEQLNKITTNLIEQISQKIDFDRTIIGSIINSLFNMKSVNKPTEDDAKNVFNTNFSLYEGEQSGDSVEMLLTFIESSNETMSDHNIDVNYSIEEIDSSATYNVSFEYGEDGYINRVIIEEL